MQKPGKKERGISVWDEVVPVGDMSHKKLKLKEFNNKIVRFDDQDIVDIE